MSLEISAVRLFVDDLVMRRRLIRLAEGGPN